MNQDIQLGKLRRTQRKSKVGLSRRQKPLNPRPEPAEHVLDLAEIPAPAALAAAVSGALASGDFAPAVARATALLLARDAAADPCAPVLAELLAALAARNGPPSWLPVHFDGRVEECFEQMLSLIHRQNIQIAELWRIAADFV